MKIYISGYRNHWISPYTILDYMFFWTDWSKCSRDKSLQHAIDAMEGKYKYVEHPKWVDRWSDRLEPISRGIMWVLDRVHPKIEYVKIDRYDTWSMDHTLAHIVLPMLKQLQATKHGSPNVDDEDAPEHLRSTAAPAKENEWDIDDNHFKRWDWALGEMIFAFECKVDDSWQDAFRSGEMDIVWVKEEKTHNGQQLSRMTKGPNDTYKCDYEGMQVVEARIQNGFRLFGKYYQALWD